MPVTLGLHTNNIRKAFSDAFGSKITPRKQNLSELAERLSATTSGPVTSVTGRRNEGLMILVISSANGARTEHRFNVDSSLAVTDHVSKPLGQPPMSATVGISDLKGKPGFVTRKDI